MRAVHFGAGNIGRGFVGLLLHRGGYTITFADVAEDLVTALQTADTYVVREVGTNPATHVVDDFHALHSVADTEQLVAAIADCEVVTTAVGVQVLARLAATIADGIAARDPGAGPVAVMACENAINATDDLRDHVNRAWEQRGHDPEEMAPRAVFANTAVDRIVPDQDPGLDVTVESYLEWVVEDTPFDGDEPTIPGVTWVDDLEPYIERKLFTVNTGHATAAWFGHAAGIERIADALADDTVAGRVRAALDDTAALVVARHDIDPGSQAAYVGKILERFSNPHLPDTTARVGRAPLRKLSRHDRFVGPAARLAERDMQRDGLLAAIGAGLAFDESTDDEAVRLQALLAEAAPDEVVAEVMGVDTDHPLHPDLLTVVTEHQAS